MAMRPIWSGSVSFGLVNIPIKLYLAAKSERFSFRMLHRKDESPVQFKRFCAVEEKEIPYDEIAKGYEYDKGQFLIIEEKDLEQLGHAAPKTVDIQQFVDHDEIPPVFFDTPYYLEPTKGAEKAYSLLRESLRRTRKVGIARVVLKEREYLAAVHVVGEALVMTTMRWAAEIRDEKELGIPGETELPEKQVALALMLVEQLTGKFKAEDFKDDYHAKVEKMLQDKLAGKPLPKAAPTRTGTKPVDLLEILQASIDKAWKGVAAPSVDEEAGERRAPRQLAARRATHPSKRTRKK